MDFFFAGRDIYIFLSSFFVTIRDFFLPVKNDPFNNFGGILRNNLFTPYCYRVVVRVLGVGLVL